MKEIEAVKAEATEAKETDWEALSLGSHPELSLVPDQGPIRTQIRTAHRDHIGLGDLAPTTAGVLLKEGKGQTKMMGKMRPSKCQKALHTELAHDLLIETQPGIHTAS